MELIVTPASKWAQTIARHWVERVGAHPDLVMCLPTGSTPRAIYDEVGAAVAAGHVSFADSTIFILDEFGGLPPGDPGRCDVMLQRDLLDKIDIPPARVHRLDPDAVNLAAVVREFRARVLEVGIDLAMVGIGVNGHIGLNEPGSTSDTITRRVDLKPETIAVAAGYGSTAQSTWGLTLGVSELLSSGEIWLLANGAHKAPILRAALEGAITPDVPASFLRNHDNAIAWADASAAAELDRS